MLDVARENGIDIPTLCHLRAAQRHRRLPPCLVEVEGSNKLLAACVTAELKEWWCIRIPEKLQGYRRTDCRDAFCGRQSCLFGMRRQRQLRTTGPGAQGGHGSCHPRYHYPKWAVDITHLLYGIDHNRCVLCSRCVRVCDEIEGAHTWDISGRGASSVIISDLGEPWGDSETCTSCGKCVQVCPTGALFDKGKTVGEMRKDRGFLKYIVRAREKKLWIG